MITQKRDPQKDSKAKQNSSQFQKEKDGQDPKLTTDDRCVFWRPVDKDMMTRAAAKRQKDGKKVPADGVVKGGSSLFGCMPY